MDIAPADGRSQGASYPALRPSVKIPITDEAIIISTISKEDPVMIKHALILVLLGLSLASCSGSFAGPSGSDIPLSGEPGGP
jgi:hypothetical protein